MNTTINVDGFNNSGTANIHGGAVFGSGGKLVQGEATSEASAAERDVVGVITVLPVETAAVRTVLDLTSDGDGCYTGNRFGEIVCVQAHEQGQGGAMNAARRLTQRFAPRVLVLCGIGGGLNTNVRLGDVVVATKVFGYDLGKETADGRQQRLRGWQSPAPIGRAVDEFFIGRGAPAPYAGFAALPGIAGSGNTVIADEHARVRTALAEINDKIIVVDMESDGVGQFCHDTGDLGWLTVRGISDSADRRKDDDHHGPAAAHAATVLRDLLPYLPKEPGHGVRR